MKYPRTLAVVSAVFLCSLVAQAQNNLNTSGIRFWLERADVIRGPEPFGEDNYYNSYQTGSSTFRNFTANACSNSSGTGTINGNCTHAVDGTASWDAGAATTSSSFHKNVISTDLNAHTPSWAFCGQWLNSTITYNGTLFGFSHGENPSAQQLSGGDYSCSTYCTHHKTMTLWRSVTGTSAGLSWTNPVEVIDGTDQVTSTSGSCKDSGGATGESGLGDCTAIADSAYAYLFCRKPNTASVVARAPLTSLSNNTGSFVKYDNGWGSQPGINGSASELTGLLAGTSTTTSHLGSSVSYWKDQNWAMLLNVEDISSRGVKVSFTGIPNLESNSVSFTTLQAPLFVQESTAVPDNGTSGGYPYMSNPPHNLYIYPSVVSLVDGTRNWDLTQKDQFLLAYTFVPPYSTLSQRLLAMRSVTVTKSASAVDPQVVVALTTRYDSNYNQRYSSTQPLAVGTASESYTAGSFSQILVDPVAYLVQVPASNPTSQGQTLTKLVECRSSVAWPGTGHPDRLITSGSCDSNYSEDTVAGYTYPNKPAVGNSVQLYRCKSSANGTHWVANNSGCDGAGTSEKSLGWAVTK